MLRAARRVLWAVFGPRGSHLRVVVVNVSLALTFCVILAVVVLIREFRDHLRVRTEAQLLREGQDLASQIVPGAPALGLPVDSPRFQGTDGRYRYTVFDPQARPAAGDELAALPPSARMDLLEAALNDMIEFPGERLARALSVKGGRIVLVSTQMPKKGRNSPLELLSEMSEQLDWISFAVLVVLATAIATARRVEGPLNNAIGQLAEIRPGAPDKRLTAEQMPSEFRAMVAHVNSAFDRLEQGYQAQRDFAANVAHEVRNPLAVLRSSIDRVEDDAQRAALRHDLERVDRIFAQLIDLARADAAGGAAMAAVDLHEIAVSLACEEAGDALRQGQRLAVTGAEVAPAQGHAGLLRVALGNLVRNARTHAPQGSEVEIEVTADPPGWRVLDRGPGVPAGMRTRLFDRFQRGRATGGTGSGLGLAIVRAAVKAHGGHAWVEDRPGGGAVFAISLPPEDRGGDTDAIPT